MDQKQITSRHKLFQCTGFGDCNMTFTRSEHLARHSRKHTGEKPFVCIVPHCTKAFSRFDNMKQHTQTHRTTVTNNSFITGNVKRSTRSFTKAQITVGTKDSSPSTNSYSSSSSSDDEEHIFSNNNRKARRLSVADLCNPSSATTFQLKDESEALGSFNQFSQPTPSKV